MEVRLHYGRYKLITDGAIYSYSDLYANFRKAFDRLNWSSHDFRHCLVLGLGLASIPDMLVNRFGRKDMRFTAVEIDETVIQMANEYVIRPQGLTVDVFTADAASFLEWHSGKYDLICADVFIGDKIPKSLQTVEALEAMKAMLHPNGILMYNRLSRYPEDSRQSTLFLEKAFLPVFPNGGYLDVDGNWMFVNDLSRFT